MNDRDIGLANVRREIERFRALGSATVEGEHTDPAGHIGNAFFWIDSGGTRKRLDFTRGELDDSREAVSTSISQKIGEAFRA
jgi:hypothetical protein